MKPQHRNKTVGEATGRWEAKDQHAQLYDRPGRQRDGNLYQKKALVRTVRKYQEAQQMSLSRCCRLFGISRQAIYQAEHRYREREKELAPVLGMVHRVRMDMPRLGTRKLHHIIKDELETREIKMGRDALFSYLKREHLLILPKKNYTRTTNSKHWMHKHPNLLKELKPAVQKRFFEAISHTCSPEKRPTTFRW